MKLSIIFFGLALATAAHAQLAIQGGIVHTMEGPAITNGVVLIKDGKIEAVGSAEDAARTLTGAKAEQSFRLRVLFRGHGRFVVLRRP